MTPPILAFQDIEVHAGTRTLLDVPSFQLEAGELASLVGPNGSGKTTFLHTAAALRYADTGQVTVAGQVVNARSAADVRRRISVVFQDPLLFSVDVLQNAALGLRFHGVPRGEANLRAMEYLRLFGVEQLAHRKPHGLSGGEAARVALARAFAPDPDLMLLDEPFSALDATTRLSLLPELRERLIERGAAALLVTHDLAEAFAFAPRLALLDGGKLIADGNIRALTTRPPSRRSAALLGAENVIPGRGFGYEQGFGHVAIAGGAHLLASHGAVLPPGAEVEVTIPAGMIRLLSAGETTPTGWNNLSALVESVTGQPGWDLVTLRAAGTHLLVREAWGPDGSRWTAGDTVTATFPPHAAWIIPGDEQS